MLNGNHSLRAGLSMLEVLVSLTLVATIMFVSLNASATVLRNRTLDQEGLEGQALAGYLLDEISTLEFRDPSEDDRVFGPEPGESASNRSTFDDVDDYDGFRETSPAFRDGQAILRYTNWHTSVAVSRYNIASDGALSLTTNNDAPLRVIAVTVTSPAGLSQTSRVLVSNTRSDRPESASFERLRRMEVTFSNDRKFDVVVPLRNTPRPTY